MQITNQSSFLSSMNLNFTALQVSEKAIKEVEYMGHSAKKYYERIWNNLSASLCDTVFYDVFINDKLSPVYIEKATGIELRNVRLRSKSRENILASADICDNGIRKTNSSFTLPNLEGLIFITGENKLIEDANDVIGFARALETYKNSLNQELGIIVVQR